MSLRDQVLAQALLLAGDLTERQQAILLAGGLLNYTKEGGK